MANVISISPSELAEIPPGVLNTLPALHPPPGVKPNFVNPDDRCYLLNCIATVLFGLMVCLFANRVYTKIYIIRKAAWDDLTCTIGFLGSIALYAGMLRGSTISGPVGKHQWDVRLVDLVSDKFVIPFTIMVFLTPLTFLFAKLTFFLLYFQLFRPLRWVRISVYIGASLTCILYGAASVVQILLSAPSRGETWLEHNLSRESYKVDVLAVPLAAIGLGIDIVLLVMPIAAIMGLQLPPKRKTGVTIIFMFGIFACIGSLLSIYYRVVARGNPDITWNLLPIELVRLVEIFIGISCACMPAFSKMVQHHLPALRKFRSVLSSRFVRLRSSKSGDTTGGSGFSQSDGLSNYPLAKTNRGPYSHLDSQLPSPQDTRARPTYELSQMQIVQTFIGKGLEKDHLDGKIHLTRGVQKM